jgi:hypothetical protein
MRTPVIFLIFNRPQHTQRVFAEIAKAKPPKLLIVADGPRQAVPGEAEKCAAARAIVEQIEWDCEVLRNYSDENLGCKRRVATGINWAFEQVEEAVVLEDDTLPHPTFFPFCEELLEKYRCDERIMHISGGNYQLKRRSGAHSYYFSKYDHIWGWASWRRAWQHYDVDMKLWPSLRDTAWLSDILGDEVAARWWRDWFDQVWMGQVDTWDSQWVFTIWRQSGLSITPNVNLVSNIGFGSDSTHTREAHPLATLAIEKMIFPLEHPSRMLPDANADRFAFELACRPEASREQPRRFSAVRRKLSRLFS